MNCIFFIYELSLEVSSKDTLHAAWKNPVNEQNSKLLIWNDWLTLFYSFNFISTFGVINIISKEDHVTDKIMQ